MLVINVNPENLLLLFDNERIQKLIYHCSISIGLLSLKEKTTKSKSTLRDIIIMLKLSHELIIKYICIILILFFGIN